MAKNSLNPSGIEPDTITRTAVLALALANQILTAVGKPIIPIEDSHLCALITSVITVIASAIAWWKNNSLTLHAQEADRYMKALKSISSSEDSQA